MKNVDFQQDPIKMKRKKLHISGKFITLPHNHLNPNNMKKISLILLANLLIFMVSCKKEVQLENTEKQPSKEELLTSHTWKGIKIIRTVAGSSGGGTESDIPNWKFIFASSHDYFFIRQIMSLTTTENGNISQVKALIQSK